MERDAKGRFVKRRPVSQEALQAAFSADKVERVLEKLHSLALDGDLKAGDLYLAYAIGKPVPSAEPKGSTGNLTWKQMVDQILNGDDTPASTD